MKEKFKLPPILLARYDSLPTLCITVLNLFEGLVVEGITLCLRSFRDQADQEVAPAQENQNVPVIEHQLSSVVVMQARLLGGQLTVLNDVITPIALSNDANLLSGISFGDRLKTSCQLLLLGEADLDWVKHFVQSVVDANDLQVLKRSDCFLDRLVGADSLK